MDFLMVRNEVRKMHEKMHEKMHRKMQPFGGDLVSCRVISVSKLKCIVYYKMESRWFYLG